MAKHHNQQRENNLARLEGLIIRQGETIETLQASGHSCPDAQRQLEELKDAVALLK